MDGVWASWLGFEPYDWNMGLQAGIWVPMPKGGGLRSPCPKCKKLLTDQWTDLWTVQQWVRVKCTRLKSALDSQFLPSLFVGSAVVPLDGAAVFTLEGCAKF